MDKCIRCGATAKPRAGGYDVAGKPSCATCYSSFCSTSLPDEEEFPGWAAKHPIAPTPELPAGVTRSLGELKQQVAPSSPSDWGHPRLVAAYHELSREREQLKTDLLEMEEQVRIEREDTRATRQQERDLKGERDTLKAQVARLERALDLAQRAKGGRR